MAKATLTFEDDDGGKGLLVNLVFDPECRVNLGDDSDMTVAQLMGLLMLSKAKTVISGFGVLTGTSINDEEDDD